MSVAFDIATKAQDLTYGTLGVDLGVNAFLNREDDEIAVFEHHGIADTRTHGDSGASFENPDVQIHVRRKNATTAWDVAYAIYKAMGNLKDQTINSHYYQWIHSTVSPTKIKDDDEKTRTIVMIQFRIQRRPES